LKTLYLIRHAKSGWSIEDQPDADRPLNERGYKDAHLVSEYLHKEEVKPDVIISSPAVRAMTTALIFAGKLHYPKEALLLNEDLYDTDKEKYLSTIHSIDDRYSKAMLFGHNPIITETSHYLAEKAIEEMPTCCVIALTFEADLWHKIAKKSGLLDFFLSSAMIP
jgi:phosphohistidine phosphatase